MFYEEQIINGILMSRTDPHGEWEHISFSGVTQRLKDLNQQRIKQLEDTIRKIQQDKNDVEQSKTLSN